MAFDIIQGDCRQAMKGLPDDFVDSIVTDPPYELGFMGKKWDKSGIAYDPVVWAEAYRVLKPGGYLIAFGGTRTYHRLASAVEDAGFQIMDQIDWVYGTGFPKAKSNLKPAHEPAVLARKPAKKVSPLQIDACRISATGEDGRWPANFILTHDVECVLNGTKKVSSTKAHPVFSHQDQSDSGYGSITEKNGEVVNYGDENGEEEVEDWTCSPDCPVATLDAQSGIRKSGSRKAGEYQLIGGQGRYQDGGKAPMPAVEGDMGGASRFFYCSKPSRRERDAGLEEDSEILLGQSNGAQARIARGEGSDDWEGAREIGLNRIKRVKNPHPTVKPIDLMRYLAKLVTPTGGALLDPFTGSGTTGIAAVLEGFDFIGAELDPGYAAIAEKRINFWLKNPSGKAPAVESGGDAPEGVAQEG